MGCSAVHGVITIDFRSFLCKTQISDDFFCEVALHALCISIDDLLIDSLHYSVSTSNTELHRLLLDCNETEQEIIIRTAKELKATLVSLGI